MSAHFPYEASHLSAGLLGHALEGWSHGLHRVLGAEERDDDPHRVRAQEGPPPVDRLGAVRRLPPPAVALEPAHPAHGQLVAPEDDGAEGVQRAHDELHRVPVPCPVEDAIQPVAAEGTVDDSCRHLHGKDHLVDAVAAALLALPLLNHVAPVVLAVRRECLHEDVELAPPALPLVVVEEVEEAHLPAEVDVEVRGDPEDLPLVPVGERQDHGV
mmetsp:Transcript_15875/g.40974  ORF Transcript_15875/g.40974 Transcript_15875/m.40974 type:complete len:214 (+) Transcript_15875:27-668(+)